MVDDESPGPRLPADYFRKPSPAREWNYLQGGKDNYAIDRAAGDALLATFPAMRALAQQCRQFLVRAVRWVAGEAGMGQFLDVGCGLPAATGLLNTHEVAQAIRPQARIVYVDNDPVVLAHARALLVNDTPDGVCQYIDSDVHDPGFILDKARETLDFDQPIAVMFFGVLGYVQDFDLACSIVGRFMRAVPSGSFLLQSDGADTSATRMTASQARDEQYDDVHYRPRSPAQIARYYDGLELLEPGVGPVALWRPGDIQVGELRPAPEYGGVARKP